MKRKKPDTWLRDAFREVLVAHWSWYWLASQDTSTAQWGFLCEVLDGAQWTMADFLLHQPLPFEESGD